MTKFIRTACLYTVVMAVLLGVIYPLAITGLAQVLFHSKANGQLLTEGSDVVGSRIIGQPFTGPGYFHSRPSGAGTGYDASASSGSNLGPTNKALIDRVQASTTSEAGEGPVPIDLVTASGSGLDPDITPAAAAYQLRRVAEQRHLADGDVRQILARYTSPRQFGLLGEPRVNVLELNLALDRLSHGQK